jgi:hypothetical protein
MRKRYSIFAASILLEFRKRKEKGENHMNKIAIATMGVFLFAAAPVSLAFSQESSDSELQARTANGVSYTSGGFGLDERAELRAMSKGDNLELSFALRNKNYLGGAEVSIKDSHGKRILETASDGPLFFAKLPEGTYTVEATALGQTLEQVAHVRSKGQTQLHFAWREAKGPTLPSA